MMMEAAPTEGDDVDIVDDDRIPTAKYVEGIVFMARGRGNFRKLAKRGLKLLSYRRGALVINLGDGGSLSFYKTNETPHSNVLEGSTVGNELVESNFRNKMSGSKVTVSATMQSTIGQSEEHYLHIPASVPWKFSAVSEHTFRIVVPPNEGKLDERVQVSNYVYFLKKKIMGKRYHEINNSSDETSRNSLVFTFRVQLSGELAVYGKAAETLGRNLHLSRSASVGKHFGVVPKANVRTRTEEGIEIAAQFNKIDVRQSVMTVQPRRMSTLGQQEFRVFPLYCYPNTWMTKKDIRIELPRTSTTFHDLRKGTRDEIGCLKFELLQASGLPNMDRVGMTDAYAYIVCGSCAFVTDVMPNNCNPCWLPRSRRACIIPIHNAYSQVYVGLFDYDGESSTDDFIGRIVLDVAQLPSDSKTIDVTLPLRAYSRVYTKAKLGSVRVRLQLQWEENGQRAALLSYFPNDLNEVKNRRKAPKNPVTVPCPDAKSFANVTLTVYGKDIPGKYKKSTKTALTREMTLISRLLEYYAKRTVIDVVSWRYPLLSAYLFCGWMHFVRMNSFKLVPAFVVSLVFIFMLKNYVKYYVNSPAAKLFGHKSIEDMTYMLLFKDRPNSSQSNVCLRKSTSILERGLNKIFGETEKRLDLWRFEDHAEFPFSKGSTDRKVSSNESAAMPLWEAAQDERDAYLANDDDDEDLDLSDDDLESDDEINNDLLSSEFSESGKDVSPPRHPRPQMRKIASKPSDKIALSDSIPNMPNLPVQNVSANNPGTPAMHQINKMHSKVQKATLHIFDDRVFLADDRDDAKKVLRFNTTKNPILKAVNPMMAKMIKIFEVAISLFRALFNILFWKGDPMLSYCTLVVVFCLMIFLLVFPWQKFFFAAGLFGIGPQNYFLVDWVLTKRARKKLLADSNNTLNHTDKNKKIERHSLFSEIPTEAVSSDSQLLIRNNTKVKPDGKLREVIVPSVPFRYNRFYDWPPDPNSVTIK